jgi:hypothetical protein
MSRFLKYSALFLLLFNSVGAFYGGTSLIVHPDGSGIGMHTNVLAHSPFSDFLIPGIVLLLCNGVFGAVASYHVWKNSPKAALWVMAQGVILLGWIIIQIFMLQFLFVLHVVMGSAGVLLVLMGWKGRRNALRKQHL